MQRGMRTLSGTILVFHRHNGLGHAVAKVFNIKHSPSGHMADKSMEIMTMGNCRQGAETTEDNSPVVTDQGNLESRITKNGEMQNRS